MDLAAEERGKRREETERQMWKLRPLFVPIVLLTAAICASLLWDGLADGNLQRSVRYMGLAPAFAWLIVTICCLSVMVAIALVLAWVRSSALYPACIFAPVMLILSRPPSVDPHFPGDAPLMFWLKFIMNCNGLLMGGLGVCLILALKRRSSATH